MFYLLYYFWHLIFSLKMPAATRVMSTKSMIDRVTLKHWTTPQCIYFPYTEIYLKIENKNTLFQTLLKVNISLDILFIM